MKFVDLFSGIGGFRLGMEAAGHECVGHCEIDKFANKSYMAIHEPKEGEWYATDITKVNANDIPICDVWCFGFPCQDISVAGRQKGLDGARSGLFYTVIELIKGKKEEDKPSILFIENVKNLLSINDGWDFAQILVSLDEIGYDAEWQVINSKYFGVPHNRERVFVIGHLRGRGTRKVFPIPECSAKTIEQIGNIAEEKGFSNPQTGRVYSAEGICPTLNTMQGGQRVPKIFIKQNKQLTDGQGSKMAIPVLTPKRLEKRQNGRRFKEDGDPSFTLTAQDRHGVMLDCSRIRELTPRECFRLQGFPDWAFDRSSKVNSNSQLYKQAGNSVTVDVIYDIARRFEIGGNDE